MQDYHGRLMFGYVKKAYLYHKLSVMLKELELQPIEQDEKLAYNLGHHFGQMDMLKAIIDVLEGMPQDDPNEKKYPKILGRPDTWPPD